MGGGCAVARHNAFEIYGTELRMIHLKSLILGAATASVLASAFAVSAQVNPNGQPVPPPPPPPGEQLSGPEGQSHFQCYRILPGPIGHAPVPITTVDQFGKQQIMLGEPIQICNPTLKIHKGKKFAVVNGQAHLMCYSIVKPEPNAGHTVKTGTQFYNRTYKTGVRTMFCAPSFKKLVGEKEYPLEG